MGINKKIKELRSLSGFSLSHLANLLGLSKSAVQQYENGTSKPSNEVLKRIADVFNVNVWDFFEIEDNSLEIDSIKFRDGHKLENKIKEIDVLKKSTINAIQSYLDIESILNENINFESLVDQKINTPSEIEKLTKKIRRKWKYGNAPIDSVVGFLESIGIKIIDLLRDNESPASCGWVGEHPFIVLNSRPEHTFETTRKRFSLLHEAGHLFLKNYVDSEKEETLCNRFAASMLLPDEVIISIFGKNRTTLSIGELKRIKESYGISIKSIIYRMSDLKLISNDAKTQMERKYDDAWEDKEEFGVYNKDKENPQRFNDLLRRAISENRIDKYKACELLDDISIEKLKNKLLVLDKNQFDLK